MFATTIFLAAVATAATASPLAPLAARTIGDCGDWLFYGNRADSAGTGALPNHPVWGKKFADHCGCTAAVQAASGPKAYMVAYDATSTICYPLGISSTGGSGKPLQTLYLDNAQAGLAQNGNYLVGTNNPPSASNCITLDMPSGNPQPACAGLIGTTNYDFGVFTAKTESADASCKLCKYDVVANHHIGVYGGPN
ncbi:hypothetical protein HKX48_000755 [Thoreauomyces humboldtii]|nr:hypothetical protein HKX48_000755 [Thoreauomyces humboldtii]